MKRLLVGVLKAPCVLGVNTLFLKQSVRRTGARERADTHQVPQQHIFDPPVSTRRTSLRFMSVERLQHALAVNTDLQGKVARRLAAVNRELHQVCALQSAVAQPNLASNSRKRSRTPASDWGSLSPSSGWQKADYTAATPPPGTGSRRRMWRPAAIRELVAHVRLRQAPAEALQQYDPEFWSDVAGAITVKQACSPFDCYAQYRRLVADSRPFTPEDDATLLRLTQLHGRRWAIISRKLAQSTTMSRTPFDLAQRFRTVAAGSLLEFHLPIEHAWQRVAPLCSRLSNTEHDSHYRLSVMSADSGVEHMLAPSAVRRALDYGLYASLTDSSGFRRKLVGILTRFELEPYPANTFMAAKSRQRYAQLSEEELRQSTRSSGEAIRRRVHLRLLQCTRGLLRLDFEKLSLELFGHPFCAMLLLNEAMELARR